MDNKRKLNIGSTILTVGYAGLLYGCFVIANDADWNTANGRHLIAGALANFAFAFSQIMIANFALRKGEKWAWWGSLIPTFAYGLTILTIDSTHVHPERMFATIVPQIAGLIVFATGLTISGFALFKK